MKIGDREIALFWFIITVVLLLVAVFLIGKPKPVQNCKTLCSLVSTPSATLVPSLQFKKTFPSPIPAAHSDSQVDNPTIEESPTSAPATAPQSTPAPKASVGIEIRIPKLRLPLKIGGE